MMASNALTNLLNCCAKAAFDMERKAKSSGNAPGTGYKTALKIAESIFHEAKEWCQPGGITISHYNMILKVCKKVKDKDRHSYWMRKLGQSGLEQNNYTRLFVKYD